MLTKHVFPHFTVSRLMEEEKMRVGKKVRGPLQLIFKVVHFLIAVIMMQNQVQVATEDGFRGCKSERVFYVMHQKSCAGRIYLPDLFCI